MRWLDWYGDGSLYVVDIALACCALEFEAAAAGIPTRRRTWRRVHGSQWWSRVR